MGDTIIEAVDYKIKPPFDEPQAHWEFGIYCRSLSRAREISNHAQNFNIALNYIILRGLEVVEKELME